MMLRLRRRERSLQCTGFRQKCRSLPSERGFLQKTRSLEKETTTLPRKGEERIFWCKISLGFVCYEGLFVVPSGASDGSSFIILYGGALAFTGLVLYI